MSSAKVVLLVEDDRFLRRACEQSLRQRGFTVVCAADGEEALAHAQASRPDIVLLDLLMPKLSGVDVLRALKADDATRHIPVLILSNSSRQEDKRAALDLGAVMYLVKSNLSLRDLGSEVIRLTGASCPAGETP